MRWTVMAALAGLLLAAGCAAKTTETAAGSHLEHGREADPHAGHAHAHADGAHGGGPASVAPDAAPSGPSICGEVRIAEALAGKVTAESILFVFAKPNAGGGPPAAVVRKDGPVFPMKFCLSQKNAMAPGAVFQGPQYLTARIEFDDNAGGRAGDLETVSKEPVVVGAADVVLTIDTVRP